MGILTRPLWQVIGLMIPRENVHCWKGGWIMTVFILKNVSAARSIKREPSTSADTITNWPANHPALASKVQIRYLRSLEADASVSKAFLFSYYQHHVSLWAKASRSLGDMKKTLDNSPRLKMEAISQWGWLHILHAHWNSPLILFPCQSRLERGGCGGYIFPGLMR